MPTASEKVRAKLDHPVIDADGHTVEFLPALIPYFQKAGIADDIQQFFAKVLDPGTGLWSALSHEERTRQRTVRPSWWAVPARNTRDFATVSMPALLHERMDELGLDFGVIYPSLGLVLPDVADDRLRRGACRALNQFHADAFEGTEKRLTPVAVVPMVTPEEAIAELEYAVESLGMKAVMIASFVRRPIEAVAERGPDVQRQASWVDSYGVDSPYDYDPFWQRCIELGVSPAAHSGAFGWDGRRSISSYMFNHIGHFSTASEALCRSLFLGGVTRRFPTLKFAFLEGGVGWACQLYSDLIEHWETRNPEALDRLDPKNLDRALLVELAEQYATQEMIDAMRKEEASLDDATPARAIEPVDDFSAARIERGEDHRDLFATPFYFGCEADDRMSAWAFARDHNPFGARLNTLFGSDIGHFDVAEMAGVLPELHELVDEGLIDDADFRDFVFTNPVRLFGEPNPDFFRGTVIEREAKAFLET